uniref:Baseplate protein J-like domain-containing protein n=1 Tax=Mycena chlorophos TaxID=658473 RepID=A0ABQ0KXM8_MYCCL|nr:predicted protein [Mycena chlorophos]
MMLGRGRTSAPANDSGTIQTLQVVLGPFETQDVAKRLAEFGFTSNPPVGSDVLMAFVCGNRDNGVIVATGHQASRPTGLEPGESMQYDVTGKYVYLSVSGIIVEAKGLPFTINDTNTATINASESVELNTPEVVISQTLRVGNGATGSFTTPTGQTVTGSALLDLQYFSSLKARIQASSGCAELQALADEAVASVNANIAAIESQLAFLEPILALLAAPGADLSKLATWIESFITAFLTPYIVPYTTYATQLTEQAAQMALIAAAIAEMAASFEHCTVTIPAVTAPSIPGDWQLSGADLLSGNDLTTAVLISLFTDRLAEASDTIPDGTTNRRGWWGDLDQDYPIGSRLWLLARSKLTQAVANKAQDYCIEALQWMIDDGVAASVTVTAQIIYPKTLIVRPVLNKSDGTKRVANAA